MLMLTSLEARYVVLRHTVGIGRVLRLQVLYQHLTNFTRPPPPIYLVATSTIYSLVDFSYYTAVAC